MSAIVRQLAEGFKHIVRICGTDLDGSKKLAYGLSKIHGLGINFSRAIAKVSKLDSEIRVGLLSDEDIQKLEHVINNYVKANLPSFLLNRRKNIETGLDEHRYGSELSISQKLDIDLMKSQKSWRGIRHSLGLKVRGQKTRTTGRAGKAIGVHKKLIRIQRAEEKTEK